MASCHYAARRWTLESLAEVLSAQSLGGFFHWARLVAGRALSFPSPPRVCVPSHCPFPPGHRQSRCCPRALHTAHHEWFCSWPFVLLNHRPWWVSKPGCMWPWAALQLPQPEQGLECRATCRQRSAPWQLCSAGPPCLGGSQRVLQGAWAQPTAPGQCRGHPFPGGFLQLICSEPPS